MGAVDGLMRGMDRAWLAATGRRYRLDVRLDLRRELDGDTLDRMDATVAAVDDLLAGTGYTPLVVEVEPLTDRPRANAVYDGRVDGRARIRMDPATWYPEKTLAHELGHDAATEADTDASPLVETTYTETVAGLTARAAMDEMEQRAPFRYDPFRPAHETEWARLRGILDPDHREERRAAVQRVRDAADRTDWNGMAAAADDLTRGPAGDATDPAPDSMVVDQFYPDAYEAQHAVRGVARSWRAMAYAADDEAAAMLDEIMDATTPIADRVRDAADGVDDPATCYTRVMDAALDAAVDDYRDALAALDPPTDAAGVVDALAETRYGDGRDGEDADGYDDWLDLPHTVGDTLAATLHDAGTGPEAVLSDPDRYVALARDVLEETVRHGLADDAAGYDPAALVADGYNS